VPVAPAPVSDRAPEAPAEGTEAPADDRPFLVRYGESLVARPGRLLTALVVTTLAALAVNEAARRPPAASAPPAPPVSARPVLDIDAPASEVAKWSVVARSAADACPGLHPEVLVAIAHVESRFGRGNGPSSAGAIGPMQFLPETWATYATDGDRDGRTDVMNSIDAMHGAARFLCAHGGADLDELRVALWRYNNSRDYVKEVLRVAGLTHRAA
jgi:soluble lytic murein transglycosylase-like protein